MDSKDVPQIPQKIPQKPAKKTSIQGIAKALEEIEKIIKSDEKPDVKAEALLFRLVCLGASCDQLKIDKRFRLSREYKQFIKAAIKLRNGLLHRCNSKYEPYFVINTCSKLVNLLGSQSKNDIFSVETTFNFNELIAHCIEPMQKMFPSMHVEPEAQFEIFFPTLWLLIDKLNAFIDGKLLKEITEDLNSPLATALQSCISTIMTLVCSDHTPVLSYYANTDQTAYSKLMKRLLVLNSERSRYVHNAANYTSLGLIAAIECSTNQLKKAVSSIYDMDYDFVVSVIDYSSNQTAIFYNLQASTSSLENEIHNLQGQNKALQNEIHNLQGQNKVLQNEIHNLQGQNKVLQNEISQSTSKLTLSEQQLTQSKKKLGESQQLEEQNKAKIEQLSQSINDLKGTLDQKEQTIAELTEQNKKAISDIKSTLDQKEQTIAKLTEQNKKAISEISDIKSTLDQKEQTIAELTEQNKKAISEISDIKSTLKDAETKIASQQSEILKLENGSNELKKELKEQEKKNKVLEDAIRDLRQETTAEKQKAAFFIKGVITTCGGLLGGGLEYYFNFLSPVVSPGVGISIGVILGGAILYKGSEILTTNTANPPTPKAGSDKDKVDGDSGYKNVGEPVISRSNSNLTQRKPTIDHPTDDHPAVLSTNKSPDVKR